MFKPFDMSAPGPVLIVVALLQIWSYPMHDPVMMDRGFIADRETTRKSFYYAAWISIVCILAFGMLGVFAGAHASHGEVMTATLTRLLGDVPMLLFNITLIISAMSTLDSTLSSSAKLVAVDSQLFQPGVPTGRLVMIGFMLSGYTSWFNLIFGIEHKYSKLLVISVIVLAGGNLAFWVGSKLNKRTLNPSQVISS